MYNRSYIIKVLCCIVFAANVGFSQSYHFDYKKYLFGITQTLTLGIQSINPYTGAVTINGGDSRAPSTPFTWYWGDGSITSGFFPQSFTYINRHKNYLVKVVATYSDGTKDSSDILVRFTSPSITPIDIPPQIAVKIPENKPTLGTRLYGIPKLTVFQDSNFMITSREIIEYVLSVCAIIQDDFVNNNVFLYNDKFEQIMLRDSTAGGAYSLWYTNPVAFGVGDGFLQGNIQYSSLFHEMGHNFTLNTPSNYYYGGKIDGNANAIFSESMANIFQHAVGYEIINNYEFYGLSTDLMFDIRQSLVSTIGVIKNAYSRFINNGNHFASWNDPNTLKDETFDTFMVIAYKFLEHAEMTGLGYREPLKRMLTLLQAFNLNWAQRYDRFNNTADADTFRATLMIAGLSYGFLTDMRNEFRSLNFPVSDSIYDEIYYSITSGLENNSNVELNNFVLGQNYPNPFNLSTRIDFSIPYSTFITLKVYNILGQEIETLLSDFVAKGSHSIQWDASKFSSGVYSYILSMDGFLKTKQLILLK